MGDDLQSGRNKVPSMAERDRIIEFLDQLLEIEGFADYGPNGLQVPGADNVELVVTGVPLSASCSPGRPMGAQLVCPSRSAVGLPSPHDLARCGSDCGSCSTPTSRWPGTTCRSMPTRGRQQRADMRGASSARRGLRRAPGTKDRPRRSLARGSLRRAARPLRAHLRPPAVRLGHRPRGRTQLGHPVRSAASSLARAIALGLDGFLTGEWPST